MMQLVDLEKHSDEEDDFDTELDTETGGPVEK